jgi:hypothetical protein
MPNQDFHDASMHGEYMNPLYLLKTNQHYAFRKYMRAKRLREGTSVLDCSWGMRDSWLNQNSLTPPIIKKNTLGALVTLEVWVYRQV